MMRPRSRCCPHADCPSQVPGAHPRVVRHASFMTRRGRRLRFLCRICGRTFAATLGTPYYRLRHSRETFDRTMRLGVEGMHQAGTARVQRVRPSTVSRWKERAALHARRYEQEFLVVEDPVEVQLDELKAFGAGERDRHWVYNGIEVSSRAWLGSKVGPRTMRTTRVFVNEVRKRLKLRPMDPFLATTDEFKYYASALRRAFGPACVHVQVDNRYRRGRIVRTSSRMVHGAAWALERAQRRSEDSRRPNTSYEERLNLHRRRTCSYLQRRTSGPMRKPERLEEALAINRLHYNFIKPHSALKFGELTRTPAMQAGAAKRPLSFREIFSWVPKPEPARKPKRPLEPGVWPRMRTPSHPQLAQHGTHTVNA